MAFWVSSGTATTQCLHRPIISTAQGEQEGGEWEVGESVAAAAAARAVLCWPAATNWQQNHLPPFLPSSARLSECQSLQHTDWQIRREWHCQQAAGGSQQWVMEGRTESMGSAVISDFLYACDSSFSERLLWLCAKQCLCLEHYHHKLNRQQSSNTIQYDDV